MKKLSLILVAALLLCGICTAFAAETQTPLYGDAYVAANEAALISFVKENTPEDAADHAKLMLTRSVLLPDLTEPAEVEYVLAYDSETERLQFGFYPHDWENVVLIMELLPDGKAAFYHRVIGNSIVTKHRVDLKPDEVMTFNHNAGSVRVDIPWSMSETETFVGWDALVNQCVGLHLYDFGFCGLCPDHQLVYDPSGSIAGTNAAVDVLRCKTCHMESETTLWDQDYYTANEQCLLAKLQDLIQEEQPFPQQLLQTATLTSQKYNTTIDVTCALMLNDRRDGVVFRMTNGSDNAVCELLLTPDLRYEFAYRNLETEGAANKDYIEKQPRASFRKPTDTIADKPMKNLYNEIYCFREVFEIWTSMLRDGCGMEWYQLGFSQFCRTHADMKYKADEPTCEGTWKEYFRCETCRSCYEVSHQGAHVYGEPVITKPVGCFEDGEQTETCTRCGKTIVTTLIAPYEHNYLETTLAATAKRDGYQREECDRCHDISVNKTIPRIASVTLNVTEYTANGKGRKPRVTVKDREGRIIPNASYTVTYQGERKTPGVYSVTIKMKGSEYKGTFIRKFRILPDRATALSVKNKKLTWKAAQTAQKYIVYYRVGKTGEFKKLGTTAKPAFSLKKLQPGKVYFFRVISYYRDAAAKTTLLSKPSATLKVNLK